MINSEAELQGLDLGYDLPALPGMALDQVLTPALILDLDALDRNIARMQSAADAAGMSLRCHGKMHKSAWVAQRQIAAGAVGICCQKASEAEAFARAGIADILVSNQVRQPLMLDRLARLARTCRIALCVDAPEAVAEAAAAATRHGTTLSVLVEIDCGARRCGVTDPAAALNLARAILAAPGLTFGGLQAYHGSAQHLPTRAERAAAIAQAGALVRQVRDTLSEQGIACPAITGAGTGTWAEEAASGLWTELQCGSYAFMDADYARVIGDAFDQALFLLAGVMSQPAPGRAVTDAGLKVLAVDSGLPVVADRPGVTYIGASDEHGTLSDPAGTLRVGDHLRLIPGHCDPTVNLHDWIVGYRGNRVERLIPVTARGKSL